MNSHHKHTAVFDAYQREQCSDVNATVLGLEDEVSSCHADLNELRLLLQSLFEELTSPSGVMLASARKDIAQARTEEQSASEHVVEPGLRAISHRLGQLKLSPSLLGDLSCFDNTQYEDRAEKVRESEAGYRLAMGRYTGSYGGLSSKLNAFNRWWDGCK